MAVGISRTFTDRTPSDAVWVGSGFNNLPVKALGGQIKYPKKGTPRVVRTIDFEDDPSAYEERAGRLALDSDVQSLWETTSIVKAAIGKETVTGACGWGPFTLADHQGRTCRIAGGIPAQTDGECHDRFFHGPCR